MDLMRIMNGHPVEKFRWLAEERDNRALESNHVNEAVIGEPNFLHTWWLEKMVTMARSVGRIKFLTGGSATGFLIAPDLLMTNNHVFENERDAKNAIIQFNYRLKDPFTISMPDEWEFDPESMFITSPELDYSIVKVKNKGGKTAGDVWGFLKIIPQAAENILINHRVNIIQHPRGELQQVAIRDNQVKAVTDTVVQYVTDTDYGTSGSVVTDDSLNVIALHNQRVQDPNVSAVHWYRNQGYRIDKILEHASINL